MPRAVALLFCCHLLCHAAVLMPEPVQVYINKGNTLSESSESLRCEAGYYCPRGSLSSRRAHPCGGAHVYCPANSEAPIAVEHGFYTAR